METRRIGAFHAFDEWCSNRDIEHRLIPIGQKEINGKVENSHRFDDREFYSQQTPTSVGDIKAKARLHNHRWNEERETKKGLRSYLPLPTIFQIFSVSSDS